MGLFSSIASLFRGSPQQRQPAQASPTQSTIRGRFDAASSSSELAAYWANADRLDADSAHAKDVRTRLVSRSRYEVANNGYSDGMVQAHANFMCGVGPSLRMTTKNSVLNQFVEKAWAEWSKSILLRRKLWLMAHAKVQDGEAFAILRPNPRKPHVGFDVVPIECDQCTSQFLSFAEPGKIDGLEFDEWGNPTVYEFSRYHPGSKNTGTIGNTTERILAKHVLHWYQLRRPGQHRGIPEFRSTLNVGATARRWREATVAAAETAADFAALIHTTCDPADVDVVAPMSELPLTKRTATALPTGWNATQMKAEHPNATYEAFHASQINEQARPKQIPKNVAMGDSSGYNFASGKLDHGTYFLTLDVERQDCIDLVLDPLFAFFIDLLNLKYSLQLPRENVAHTWDFPRHPIADVVSESRANEISLRTGATTLSDIYSRSGQDFEEKLVQMARDFGVTVPEMRQIIRTQLFSTGQAVQVQQDQVDRQGGGFQ